MYQPCGVEALHPSFLNGTGFSPNITASAAVPEPAGGDGVVGAGVLLEQPANNSPIAVVASMQVAPFKFTVHALQ